MSGDKPIAWFNEVYEVTEGVISTFCPHCNKKTDAQYKLRGEELQIDENRKPTWTVVGYYLCLTCGEEFIHIRPNSYDKDEIEKLKAAYERKHADRQKAEKGNGDE
jgi:hypothetical protein